MTRKQLAVRIELITKSIDELKTVFEFEDSENEEEFLNIIEDSVTNLQELEEILDRDQEYSYYKQQLIEPDEDCNHKNR